MNYPRGPVLHTCVRRDLIKARIRGVRAINNFCLLYDSIGDNILIRLGRGAFPVCSDMHKTPLLAHTHTGYRRAAALQQFCRYTFPLWLSALGFAWCERVISTTHAARAVQLEQPINYDSYATPTHKFRSTYSSLIVLLYAQHSSRCILRWESERRFARSLCRFIFPLYALGASAVSAADARAELVCCRVIAPFICSRFSVRSFSETRARHARLSFTAPRKCQIRSAASVL